MSTEAEQTITETRVVTTTEEIERYVCQNCEQAFEEEEIDRWSPNAEVEDGMVKAELHGQLCKGCSKSVFGLEADADLGAFRQASHYVVDDPAGLIPDRVSILIGIVTGFAIAVGVGLIQGVSSVISQSGPLITANDAVANDAVIILNLLIDTLPMFVAVVMLWVVVNVYMALIRGNV